MCVLRILGDELDVDALQRTAPLEVTARFERGKRQVLGGKPYGRPSRSTGINVDVSDAGFNDLEGQIGDAREFLRDHAAVLRAARGFPGVESMSLDFGIELRDVAAQSDSFPADLLAEMGALGIDLMVTRYAISEENPDDVSMG